MMIHTNELEIQQSSGTKYWDCFRGVDLRRTEVACIVWLIQQFCVSPMIGWGTYFMEQAGLSPTNAFNVGIGQTAMGFCRTVRSWFPMPYVGRRPIYFYGQIVMFCILIALGGTGIPKQTVGSGWGAGAFILIFTFAYDFAVGPVCYSLVAEIPSTRLKIKTVVISRNLYNLAEIFINIVQPRMLNPTAWNWGAKAAFFWAGFCALCIVWTYFRLPEPKGLTYAELDVLFENRVRARAFRKVEVDPYRSDNPVTVLEDEATAGEMAHEKKGF
jgi:MFS transporter, SP family, general alpha glucoside:H+ symporter